MSAIPSLVLCHGGWRVVARPRYHGAHAASQGAAMISTRLRLMLMLGRWFFKERGLPSVAVSQLPLRCWWVDCDINRHMNNSRYLALMDMGRWHYLLVSGLAAEVWRRRWMPVVVRIDISFQLSLKPGTRFGLMTRLEEVGNRSITLVQEFRAGDRVMASARVVALFLADGKSQSVAPLFNGFSHLLPEPLLCDEGVSTEMV